MKSRNSNLELLRIISIFMIILGHTVWETSWNESTNFSVNSFIIQNFWIGAKLGVNLFVLISGFFLSTRVKFKVKPIFKLWINVVFYSWMLLLFSFLLNLPNRNFENIIASVLPISFNCYWFITCYFFIYLISPVVNILIKEMTIYQFGSVLTAGFIYMFVFGLFFKNETAGSGNTWITLLFVYLIGAFIRKYNIVGTFSKRKLGYISLIQILIMSISIFAVNFTEQKNILTYNPQKFAFFTNGNSPFQLIASVCIFLIFCDLKPQSNKYINKIASATLAVYMLHTNYLIKSWLFNSVIRAQRFQNTVHVIPYIIGCAVLLYVLFVIIDLVKQFLLDGYIDKLSEKFSIIFEEKLIKLVSSFQKIK